MTYFITIEELKQTTFNANLDNEYIAPALEEAQSIYLREIIGDLLYSSITNKIDSETLSGKYLTLVNQYIKPYLTYKVQSVIVIPLNNKTRNAGIINQYDQGFNTSTMKDTAYLADYYNSRAEFYANRLTTYLQKNAADFPEYGYSDDNITQPTETQNVTTIYLGGGRKKGCGCNTSTPQATAETVDWDNIQNRPDFAQVATSGDYIDLDNKPEIPSLDGYATEQWVNDQGYSTFDGDYNSLTNKPTIPTVPTNVSAFNNDAGYTTFDGDYNNLTNKPTIPVVPTNVSAFNNDAGYTTFDGDYNSLSNKPTIPTVNNATLTITQGGVSKGTFTANAGSDVTINLDAGGGTQVQSDWAQSDNQAIDYIKNKPTIPAAQVQTDWNANSGMAQILNKPSLATVATSGSYPDLHNRPSLKAVATSGDYNDLSNKPTIPAAQVQSDWNEADTSSKAYIANKPTIPAAQVQSDWNANSGMGEILNKPSMTAETWTFTLSDNTTVTKTVWLQ